LNQTDPASTYLRLRQCPYPAATAQAEHAATSPPNSACALASGPSTGKFIAYYRVSTGKQGKSGLGVEAQQQAVKTYLNGGDWEIVGEFTEIESGKRSDRPALDKALAAARLHRAALVVSRSIA
jgi:hypothetical protein